MEKRYDVMEEIFELHSDNFLLDDNGYLTGRAIVTNIGVFTYSDGAGNIIRELRPPEEVFNWESMKSLKMCPITNDHPGEFVTSKNIKDYQKGNMGTDIMNDSYALSGSIKITDDELISEIKSGKKSLSCGYTADLEYKSGNWLGVAYDAIQRNIRYNHVAVVSEGRAGDLVKMILDSKEGGSVSTQFQDIKIQKEDTEKKQGGEPMLKKISYDGIEYQAENDFIKIFKDREIELSDAEKTIKDLSEKLSKIQEDLSVLEADRDSLKDEKEELEKKAEESKMTDEEIQKAVEDRISLLEIAKSAKVEVESNDTERAIKEKVIKSIFPAVELEEKNDVYVSARFDSSVDILVQRKKAEDTENKNNKNEDVLENKNTSEDSVISYESKREEYIESMKNAYKKEAK